MSTSTRKEPLSRKEKIKFLNDLIQGKTTFQEQFPGKERIFIKREENEFFKEISTGKHYFVSSKVGLQEIFPYDKISIIRINRIIIGQS